ncbi:MAG: zinc-binding dehydrogenase [Bacilli bacterium]
MKAALMYGANDIRIEEIPDLVCQDDGLILEVEAVGLCGSDIRNLTTDSKPGKYTHIYGHEVIGKVVAVGSKVSQYQINQRLYVYPGVHCLHCEFCMSGHSEMCASMKNTLDRQGGFAQYMPIEADQINSDVIYVVPDDISSIDISLAEPLSSVYAAQENVNLGFLDTVVIIGAGPIGCFHAKLAKLRGASLVIMIEINDERLNKALEFGVDHIINSQKEDAIAKVLEYTNNEGASVVISANPSTKAQSDAVYMCKKGGVLVLFGGVAKGALTPIDTNFIHYNNIWVYGHYGANSIQVKRAFDLVCNNVFPASQFITHVLPLAKIKEGIELSKQGAALKIVLLPNQKEE